MGKLVSNHAQYDQKQWLALAEISCFRPANLARHLGLSQRQVERYIRRHFDLTPQEWLRALRMEKARQLVPLMNSVKEVAYALGFLQVSHFCREFKSFHGVTCSDYAASVQTPGSADAAGGSAAATNVVPFRVQSSLGAGVGRRQQVS